MRVESISESKRREPKRLLVSIVVHILSNPCKKKEQPLPNFFFFNVSILSVWNGL